jgi:hypothetical protein
MVLLVSKKPDIYMFLDTLYIDNLFHGRVVYRHVVREGFQNPPIPPPMENTK